MTILALPRADFGEPKDPERSVVQVGFNVQSCYDGRLSGEPAMTCLSVVKQPAYEGALVTPREQAMTARETQC